MKKTVVKGDWYTVSSKPGCTVQNGPLVHEVEANAQLAFQALGEFVQIDGDDEALLLSANFDSAPVKLRLLGLLGGGANTLPSGYIAAEFLESTGTQYIDTAIKSTGSMRFEVDVEAVEWVHVNYALGSENKAGNVVLSLNYNNAQGTAGAYRYGSKFGYFSYGFNKLNVRYNYVLEAGRVYRDGVLALAYEQEEFTSSRSVTLFGSYHDNNNPYPSGSKRIWKFIMEDKGERLLHFVPAITPAGEPCMFDKVSKQPFFKTRTGEFIVGMDMTQARKLGKLPNTGGELTISLPWEAGVDAQVQEALAKAAENGWTVVVQYREPEVATENISVDFLEGTGTQWVESNAYLSKLHDFDLEIADLSGSQAWGREDGGFVLSMGMQTYGIRFIYANGGYQEVRLTKLSGRTLIQKRGNVFSMNGVSATADFTASTAVSTKPVRIFSYQGKAPYIGIGKWFRQTVYLNGETVQDVRMALDVSGVPCMHDSVSGESFYNAGSGTFIAGFESTEKAALGLAKLPVVTEGELTVSLPAAAQDEATRVPAAIEVARQRGWTIITQYRD